jgi:5-methylcytosine-specific restriction endonuclease McrA
MSYSNITWLRVSDLGKNKTYHYRNDLHKLGYEFDWNKKEWVKQSEGNDIEIAKTFCNQSRLKLVIDLPQYRRSYDYRKQFLESNPGVFGKGFYFCSYCGKPIGEHGLEVDHLFSVNSAQNSAFVKWIMKKSGMDTVNHEKNIIPACVRCNRRKGKKSGLWVLRGFIGQHQTYWITHWIFMCILILFSIWFVMNHPIKAIDVLTFIRKSVLFLFPN